MSKTVTNVRLDALTKLRLEKLIAFSGRTQTQIISQAIDHLYDTTIPRHIKTPEENKAQK